MSSRRSRSQTRTDLFGHPVLEDAQALALQVAEVEPVQIEHDVPDVVVVRRSEPLVEKDPGDPRRVDAVRSSGECPHDSAL